MSENIKDIISQNKESFLGREKEVQDFLIKNYTNTFKYPLIKFERIDTTDRIKKAGFQKNLSSWQNVYKNIVLVSCYQISGEKKRYDFKFYFIEEKLDEKTLELVESTIKQATSLSRDFKFREAEQKVDETLDLIKEKNDQVINKRLQDTRNEVSRSETDYNAKLQKLEVLETNLKTQQESYNLDDVIKTSTELVAVTKAVKKYDQSKKYESVLNNAKKEKEKQAATLKEKKSLEAAIQRDQESKKFQSALTNCDKLILLAQTSNDTDLEKKYTDVREQIKTKLESQKEQEQKITELEKEVETNKNQSKFEEAIKNCDDLTAIAKTLENQELIQKYDQLTQQTQKEYEEYKKQQERTEKEKKIEKLDSELNNNRTERNYEPALNNCASMISIAKELNRSDLVAKYEQISEEIKKEQGAKRVEEEDSTVRKQKKEALFQKLKEQTERKEREQNELRETSKQLENVIHIDENVMPIMESIPVSEIIGNLSDDINESLAQVTALLEEHRVSVKNEIKNTAILTTASGNVTELENVNKVQQSEQKDQNVTFSAQSGFINPFDEVLEESILNDVIPYNFEITQIRVEGKVVNKLPDKTFTNDGLELNWKFQNVQPRKKLEIDYNLRRRISRTIIYVLDQEVKIIKTHSNYVQSKNIEGLYDADLPFTNTYSNPLEHVVIEDIIPIYYVHFIKEPKKQLPNAVTKATQGALIKWQVGLMEPKTLDYFYKLLELYKFEELKIKVSNLDSEGFNSFKNQDLATAIEKYDAILKELSNFS